MGYPMTQSWAWCFSIFFINYLDERVQGMLVKFADYTKLGGIANNLEQRSLTFLAWGRRGTPLHSCACPKEHVHAHAQRSGTRSGGTHAHAQRGGGTLMWVQERTHRHKWAVWG